VARFLALPKNDPVIASLSMADVTMAPEARAAQVARVIEARRRLGAQTRGPEPAARARMRSAEIVAHPEETTSVTGVMVFDMDDPEELERLKTDLPNYDVVEDLPLSLIQPVRATASHSVEAGLDLWHLDAVAVAAARAAGFGGTGKGVGVAILDTGVEEVEEIAGRVASAFRLDRTTNTPVAIQSEDTEGHGTHVAGLVAGSRVGVAPEADLMNYVMIPNALGNISDFIFAIDFVARRPEISILNMSAGIPGFHGAMKSSVVLLKRMGILPVIAVGNEGPNTSRSPGNYAEVLSVGAANRHGRVASFSSGGSMVADAQSYDVPDLVAPGAEVTSCVMGGGYEAWDGSSMATPLVSGIAALIVERFPTITLSDLTEEIIGVLQPLSGVDALRQGGGMLQLPPHLWQAVS
jgi:subtilisin family serine protease